MTLCSKLDNGFYIDIGTGLVEKIVREQMVSRRNFLKKMGALLGLGAVAGTAGVFAEGIVNEAKAGSRRCDEGTFFNQYARNQKDTIYKSNLPFNPAGLSYLYELEETEGAVVTSSGYDVRRCIVEEGFNEFTIRTQYDNINFMNKFRNAFKNLPPGFVIPIYPQNAKNLKKLWDNHFDKTNDAISEIDVSGPISREPAFYWILSLVEERETYFADWLKPIKSSDPLKDFAAGMFNYVEFHMRKSTNLDKDNHIVSPFVRSICVAAGMKEDDADKNALGFAGKVTKNPWTDSMRVDLVNWANSVMSSPSFMKGNSLEARRRKMIAQWSVMWLRNHYSIIYDLNHLEMLAPLEKNLREGIGKLRGDKNTAYYYNLKRRK